MGRIRKRLTYANVVSSLALFLVLTGATAFAASKIGADGIAANAVRTGKIKKEAVTTAKIKKNAVDGSRVRNGSLTGADLDLARLGTVPSAAAVGGQALTSFSREVADNGVAATALEFGGVKLTLACPGGKPTISAANVSGLKAGSRLALVTEVGSAKADGQSPFSVFEISKDNLGGGSFEAVFENGKVTSILFSYRDDGFNTTSACRVFGHAIGG